MKYNGKLDGRIRERIRKRTMLGQVWGIGKRRFGGDWDKRICLTDWCGR